MTSTKREKYEPIKNTSEHVNLHSHGSRKEGVRWNPECGQRILQGLVSYPQGPALAEKDGEEEVSLCFTRLCGGSGDRVQERVVCHTVSHWASREPSLYQHP